MNETNMLLGVLLAVFAGALNGTFALPMRLMKKWKWENTWLIYTLIGMIVVPWIVAYMVTPNLRMVIGKAPLLLICSFGLAWGIGSVFFGMGIARLGIGLGLALIMGFIAGIGSLVPMLVLDRGKFATRAGAFIIAGNVILILGIAFCARAGDLREKMRAQRDQSNLGPAAGKKSALLAGVIIAVLSGVFSAMLNFSFAFSKQVQDYAVSKGTSPKMVAVFVFALAVSTGYLVNLIFCLVQISRSKPSGWSAYKEKGTGLYWIGTIIMGIMWFGAFIVYGIGASYIGASGAVIGWPIMMGGTIVFSNIAGWLTGEWTGSDRNTVVNLVLGILVILVGIVVMGQGNA